MAEMAMAVDPPAPIASTSALPPAPKPLPIIMMINGNSIIIPAPAFIPKRLPAAIATKPIPHRYTGSTETRPGVWVNAGKACDLADCMDISKKGGHLHCLLWVLMGPMPCMGQNETIYTPKTAHLHTNISIHDRFRQYKWSTFLLMEVTPTILTLKRLETHVPTSFSHLRIIP